MVNRSLIALPRYDQIDLAFSLRTFAVDVGLLCKRPQMRDLRVYSQIYYRRLSVVLIKKTIVLVIVDAFLEIVLIPLLKGHLYSMERDSFSGSQNPGLTLLKGPLALVK